MIEKQFKNSTPRRVLLKWSETGSLPLIVKNEEDVPGPRRNSEVREIIKNLFNISIEMRRILTKLTGMLKWNKNVPEIKKFQEQKRSVARTTCIKNRFSRPLISQSRDYKLL